MDMRGRAALERGLADITPGQWGFRDYKGEALAFQYDSTQGRITGPGGVIIAKDVGRANAVFIIWAAERFRELMDQVDKLKGALELVATYYEGSPEDQYQSAVSTAEQALEKQAKREALEAY